MPAARMDKILNLEKFMIAHINCDCDGQPDLKGVRKI